MAEHEKMDVGIRPVIDDSHIRDLNVGIDRKPCTPSLEVCFGVVGWFVLSAKAQASKPFPWKSVEKFRQIRFVLLFPPVKIVHIPFRSHEPSPPFQLVVSGFELPDNRY